MDILALTGMVLILALVAYVAFIVSRPHQKRPLL
jgi:hypothetical protein